MSTVQAANRGTLVGVAGPRRAQRSGRVTAAVAACALLAASDVECRVVIDLAVDSNVVRIDGSPGDRTGVRIASCDLNGDGIDDLVIGADEADGVDDQRFRAGETFVVFGRRGAWSGSYSLEALRDVRIIGEEPLDNLGFGLACGDVDGDGVGDALVCARSSDSVGNAREAAGQAHLLLGRPTWPGEIDLAQAPQTTFWGATAGDVSCGSPVIADIDDDGFGDVVIDAIRADGLAPGVTLAGQSQIVFGRADWPNELDLLTDSDVRVYGAARDDQLGWNQIAGDLDGDGIEDLLLLAIGGDGFNDTRSGAGDTHLLRGKTAWPAVIDLAVESADTMIFGADRDDAFGDTKALALGDIDLDGVPDLALGSWLADGPTNGTPETGEIRVIAGGAELPVLVDLRFSSDSVVYGGASGDWSCSSVYAGDINHDGFDDLICGSTRADGPSDERPDCGETTIFFGRAPFPSELSLAAGDEDVAIIGALGGNELEASGTVDLNGDGVLEVLVASSVDHPGDIPSVWLISPLDSDADGVAQLADNCPLVHNPGQQDSDADRRGDACQADYDGDGQTDTEDCAPASAAAGTPESVQDLVLSGGVLTELSWPTTAFADAYDVARGSIAELDGLAYGACRGDDPDSRDTTYFDSEVPPTGDGYFYLVRGVSETCGVAGSWGLTSDGTGREDGNLEVCP